jgi:ribonuclease III
MVGKLETRLGYTFEDQRLLKLALTHCSAGKDNNERLEFLGDAVLGLVVSNILYRRFPAASEGELSRLRASLVQQSTLADIARKLQLGEHLILGSGELKTGGANRESTLADALEAVLSALFLDAGMQVCEERISLWFEDLLKQHGQLEAAKDAKTTLQEYLQARKLALPTYQIIDIQGKDHQQEFKVHCCIGLLKEPVLGLGASRKEAEQQAAAEALHRIGASHE